MLPMIVDHLFSLYGVPYQLPWGRPWDWSQLSITTYIEFISLYFILMFFFFFIDSQINLDQNFETSFNLNRSSVLFILILTVLAMTVFVISTGGFEAWIFSYKEAFLKGRGGAGGLNFIFIYLSNLLAFLLGLVFYKSSGLKVIILVSFSIFSLLFFSYFQGLKSRFIILLLIFFSPYLISLSFSIWKFFVFGSFFIVLIYFFTYIRSDGFYSSPIIFLEYTMTYFNVVPLHDLVVKKEFFGLFSTLDHLLVKPAQIVGFEVGSDFDLSVMLTKEYYPRDLEEMRATQQWPLLTDLRYNYYGLLLGWFFILTYVFFMTFIYRKARQGDMAFLFIFMLEFVRIFSVLRGTLIPWQIFIYIPIYSASFIFLRKYITTSAGEQKFE
jgi:hypothetical protein